MQSDSSPHSVSPGSSTPDLALSAAAPGELELRKDLTAAGLLQRRMLPPSPMQFSRCAIDYQISPAATLSGDFVGVTELADQSLAFIVADVAGHGASAALPTVWLKGFMCRQAAMRDAQPAQLLQAMNTELLALGIERHVCVVCGVIDQAAGTLVLSCAGAYPKPVLTRASDKAGAATSQPLETPGKALGLFADVQYSQQSFAMQPQDRLTIVTDGLFELLGNKDLSTKEAQLAGAANQPTRELFWKSLGVSLAQPCCDDVTWFQLEWLA